MQKVVTQGQGQAAEQAAGKRGGNPRQESITDIAFLDEEVPR